MIDMIKWRQDIIARPDRVAIPVMTHPGIEELGYTVKQAVLDGSIHGKAVSYLADRYTTHAASVIMDLTVEAEAFGAEVIFPEDEIPSVTGHMLNGVEDIHRLEVPSLNTARVPEYIKANVIAHREISDRPVFAGCIGPFSLAGRLYDMSEIMMLIYSDPEAAHELLEKCTLFILKYVAALKATGVEGVLMAEPAAGLMSNDDCKTFSSNYVKRIIDQLQDEHFMIVLHNCGNTGQCTEAMVMTGAHGLHLGNKCDLAQVARETPEDILVMGNLDPVSAFKMSTPEEMYQQTMELLENTREFPHVVLSSGCDTPPHTPLANVDQFFKALEDYNTSL
ncbi:MAG: uroporphyrinogen decarboxylase family protein [Prevotella sp.]|nr:uroporphyrinogen decarboxylase family protein [Prevotella sp.]